ncbi:MAG: ABC transporter substrate-binding protein [Pseudomonadota bacterium]|nr:ABC transporter substrate-binding protein [Pseudomonadota bacterium]
MTRKLTALFAGLAALSLAAAPALAQGGTAAASDSAAPTAEAEAFTRELTAKATAALTDESLSREQQLEKFQAVLGEGLALDVIGRFMLGDKRKTMTPEQIARYDAVFPDYITKLYAEQFDEIVGRPLEVLESKSLNARDTIVRTQFKRTSGSPIMVDWRVRKLKDGGHKMLDIIVSGVSIMLVKREEFSAFIAANNIDALLDRLEQEAKA